MRPCKVIKSELFTRAGETGFFPVKFLPEGFLSRVYVREVGGAVVNFTVGVFDSRNAMPGVGSHSSAGPVPGSEIEPYRVCPEVTGTAGVAAAMFANPGYPFTNMDGTLSQKPNELVIKIDPVGSADYQWEVTLVGYSPSIN